MHDLLSKVLDGVSLTQDQAEGLLRAMIAPGTPAVQVAAALAGLRAKGESAEELAGFARGMRAVALDPKLPASDLPTIDIVGTGGDGAQTLNISTAAALLVAATGRARVAKHGNRAISSSCGSADVLAALGVPGAGGAQGAWSADDFQHARALDEPGQTGCRADRGVFAGCSGVDAPGGGGAAGAGAGCLYKVAGGVHR